MSWCIVELCWVATADADKRKMMQRGELETRMKRDYSLARIRLGVAAGVMMYDK